MPLEVIDPKRVRVLCDHCRSETAEVYGKRDMPVMATVAAIRKFKSVGWRHEPFRQPRPNLADDAERTGSGRWYCAKCAKERGSL